MSILQENFGKSPKGEEITLYTLENENGMKAKVTDFGAILVNLFVPDKNKKLDDVVLGYDNVEGYYDNPCFLGSTIGRNSNRVGNAQFELNGVVYKIDKNEGENNLHGGFDGYNKRKWNALINEKDNFVKFTLASPHMDQGFPGNFNVTVTYKLTKDNELVIRYEGTSDKDTVVNLTNHSYFNLSGHGSGSVLEQDRKSVV